MSLPTHTDKILRDNIHWLKDRVQRLEAAAGASERKLADCYRKLLRQRERQLASMGGICPDCWQDYFG